MPNQRHEKLIQAADYATLSAHSKRTIGGRTSGHSSTTYQPLLVVQGSTALAGWQVVACTGRPTPQEQLMHHTRRVYDRSLLGFCYVVDSLSVSLSYKAANASILHPWLAIQLFVPHECKKLSIELCVNDVLKSNQTKIVSKRRIFVSTAIKEVKSTPLHASLPLESALPREEWTTLLFDLNAIVSSAYRNCRFRSVEAISIQGDKIKLRNIYTLRSIATISTEETTSASSRSSTSLSLSTVSSSCEPSEFSPDTAASQLDTVSPRQLAYPFTMNSSTSWVVIRGGPESCHHLHSQSMSETSLRPGQLKKADSGLSISLSPSTSLSSLVAPTTSASAEHHVQNHQQANYVQEPLEISYHSKVAPSDPSLMSMVDRVRRRKAALDRINEISTVAPQPSQQLQPPRQQHAPTSGRSEPPSALAQHLPVFPSAIPRPAGGFTGRGPTLAPIARSMTHVKPVTATVTETRGFEERAAVDPYDLEVQQAMERAMRKANIHNEDTFPATFAPMPEEPHSQDGQGAIPKALLRTDSGAKSKTPSDVAIGAPAHSTEMSTYGIVRQSGLSPVSLAIGREGQQSQEVVGTGDEGEDSIELVYDSEVGAYFDPQTNKYFTLQS